MQTYSQRKPSNDSSNQHKFAIYMQKTAHSCTTEFTPNINCIGAQRHIANARTHKVCVIVSDGVLLTKRLWAKYIFNMEHSHRYQWADLTTRRDLHTIFFICHGSLRRVVCCDRRRRTVCGFRVRAICVGNIVYTYQKYTHLAATWAPLRIAGPHRITTTEAGNGRKFNLHSASFCNSVISCDLCFLSCFIGVFRVCLIVEDYPSQFMWNIICKNSSIIKNLKFTE